MYVVITFTLHSKNTDHKLNLAAFTIHNFYFSHLWRTTSSHRKIPFTLLPCFQLCLLPPIPVDLFTAYGTNQLSSSDVMFCAQLSSYKMSLDIEIIHVRPLCMDATHNRPPTFATQMHIKRNSISYIRVCKKQVVFRANVCVFCQLFLDSPGRQLQQ